MWCKINLIQCNIKTISLVVKGGGKGKESSQLQVGSSRLAAVSIFDRRSFSDIQAELGNGKWQMGAANV